jgi:hypothetical protein
MFEWLSQSTWGYPIIAAVHVLGMAWFGALALAPDLHARRLKWIGVAVLLASGIVLFALHPDRYYASIAFRTKMVLLAAIALFNLPRSVLVALWAGVIVAARFIAFFCCVISLFC